MVTGEVGEKVATTVHEDTPESEVPHVPPVPGKDPPLNGIGALRTEREIEVAVRVPEFEIVIDPQDGEPTLSDPKS